jgi:hypothetical protein
MKEVIIDSSTPEVIHLNTNTPSRHMKEARDKGDLLPSSFEKYFTASATIL